MSGFKMSLLWVIMWAQSLLAVSLNSSLGNRLKAGGGMSDNDPGAYPMGSNLDLGQELHIFCPRTVIFSLLQFLGTSLAFSQQGESIFLFQFLPSTLGVPWSFLYRLRLVYFLPWYIFDKATEKKRQVIKWEGKPLKNTIVTTRGLPVWKKIYVNFIIIYN